MSIDPLNVPASTKPQRSPVAVASWALLIVWLGSSAASFWFMELRDWRSFGRADTVFGDIDTARVEDWYRSNIDTMPAAAAHPRLTLIHLYNPDCRCNRFVDPHLKRLVEHYQSLGVEFIAAPARAVAANAVTPVNLPAISATYSTLASAGVNSSPAALIFDANGRLIYYGPYSDSAWCGSTGNLVEPVLERALSGLASARHPRASRGCFCGW
jgi:Domain of unknown function (DUF6436)